MTVVLPTQFFTHRARALAVVLTAGALADRADAVVVVLAASLFAHGAHTIVTVISPELVFIGHAEHSSLFRSRIGLRQSHTKLLKYPHSLIDRVVRIFRLVSSSITWRSWAGAPGRTTLSEFTGDWLVGDAG